MSCVWLVRTVWWSRIHWCSSIFRHNFENTGPPTSNCAKQEKKCNFWATRTCAIWKACGNRTVFWNISKEVVSDRSKPLPIWLDLSCHMIRSNSNGNNKLKECWLGECCFWFYYFYFLATTCSIYNFIAATEAFTMHSQCIHLQFNIFSGLTIQMICLDIGCYFRFPFVAVIQQFLFVVQQFFVCFCRKFEIRSFNNCIDRTCFLQ